MEENNESMASFKTAESIKLPEIVQSANAILSCKSISLTESIQSTESIISTDPFLSIESVLSIACEDEKEDKKKLGKAHKIIIPFDYEIEIALKEHIFLYY